ncbi:ribosome recycling factor [Thalassoporum mexicanum PCC 7367]|uniref:ribosome recycling factor n=1 Tax=Thalassoporum mexicanum TaxID=3457544 RepID=UPI00029FF366|nr:ribosome recycling factor [Pseudanabaena sp. PCC 7367]AFY70472.1 ribosome recycling factor [Pseudanabaena sp. PCC 7367]
MKLTEVEDKMQKAIDATQSNFNTVRTGRASTSLLDRINVEYYGMPTPLKSLANISTPDSSTITIQPYDKGSMGQIERAIAESDLGLMPNNDGQVIRLNIPQLTTERREELIKMVAKLAEEGKVAIRNVRRDAIDSVRKQEKAKEISEDESRGLQEDVDKLTSKYTKKIDDVLAAKEKEISTV